MSISKKTPIPVPEDNRKGNRRAFPRWQADFEVRYGLGKDLLVGTPFEIGEGGLSFQVEKMFPLESEVDIQYRLGRSDSKEEWVSVRGVVRHAAEQTLGVEFLNLRRNDRLKIIDFINERAK
jgi:c-di-GMP-binding flagellar brake protein YcgR